MRAGIAQHGARFKEIRDRGFQVENVMERSADGAVIPGIGFALIPSRRYTVRRMQQEGPERKARGRLRCYPVERISPHRAGEYRAFCYFGNDIATPDYIAGLAFSVGMSFPKTCRAHSLIVFRSGGHSARATIHAHREEESTCGNGFERTMDRQKEAIGSLLPSLHSDSRE